MFTAPRFLAVDDKKEHLDAIVQTFQLIGTPCMGVHYNPETPLDKSYFRGVRALFLDLHLIPTIPGTDEKKHFTHIASILEDNIDPAAGPYILIVWTQYEGVADGLIQYLDANLEPTARPIAVLPLAKEDYIDIATGAPQHAAALREAIEKLLTSNAQLAALLSWESDVLAAAGATLAALLELVPTASRQTALYPGALDTQLSRLAVAAAGPKNVTNDKRAALNAALSPILSDRIQNQIVSQSQQTIWDRAITKDQDEHLNTGLTFTDAGRVNKMLHLATPEGEKISPSDWGAVVDFPPNWKTDEQMKRIFSSTLAEIINRDFKVKPQDVARCQARLVRVGAVCDQAQGNTGPVPYLMALEIPAEVKRDKPTDAEWKSPAFVLQVLNEPFRLHVNSRHLVTRTYPQIGGWTVRYRLREQVLMDLIAHAAGYISRPGIVYTGRR
jgi:hypothetical protein